MIFDKTVVIKQLNVVEAHGLLLFRADKGQSTLGKENVIKLYDVLRVFYENVSFARDLNVPK